MAQKKRIRELTRNRKRFAVCREIIEKNGWIPQILCDQSGVYWDGFTATDKEGKSVNGLSDSFRKEMVHLILDGAYGEQAKDAILDQSHYWRVRDELITWPNQEAIVSKKLRVLGLRLNA
jgi:hypothetical protein